MLEPHLKKKQKITKRERDTIVQEQNRKKVKKCDPLTRIDDRVFVT